MFGLDICAGIAIGVDGNLYIGSDLTNEVVVISRDGSTEIRRFDVGVGNIAGVDGVSLIAGSENFLVVGTDEPTAAIFDPLGNVVVQGAPHGLDKAPLKGGTDELLDATLTLCATGHAWVCEAGSGKCWDYAPDDGDKNTCQCLIPQ